jgi:hypothetical protein
MIFQAVTGWNVPLPISSSETTAAKSPFAQLPVPARPFRSHCLSHISTKQWAQGLPVKSNRVIAAFNNLPLLPFKVKIGDPG